MVKTGLKWLKTTQNVPKTCFYDFLEKFIFSIFCPKMPKNDLEKFRQALRSPGNFRWQCKKAHSGPKMVKTG
jgi:hypothetical protein